MADYVISGSIISSIEEVETTIVLTEDTITYISEGIQGPQGIQGIQGISGSSENYTSAVALSGHRIVFIDSTSKADYASNDNQTHVGKVVGMTVGASSLGALATIKSYGELTEPSWNWTSNLPIYLGTNGGLTQTQPSSPAKFSQVVAFATSTHTAFINIQPPIVLL